MTYFYALVKPKNAKKWYGAIPMRQGLNRDTAYKKARRKVRKSYKIRIITKSQLSKYIKQLKR